MGILNLKRNFIIEHENYVFNYKVPTPSTKIEIDTKVAKRLKGVPLESIPDTTYWYSVAIETLNVCLTTVDKSNKELEGIDWGDVDDYDFVSQLYQKCSEVEKKFREELKKNNHSGKSDIGSNVGHFSNENIPNNASRGEQSTGFGSRTEDVPYGVGNNSGGFSNDEEQDYNSIPNRDGKRTPPRRVSVK